MTRFALGLAVLAAGCDGSLAPAPCAGGACGTQVSIRKTFQQSVSRRVDLLFVVDDTPAIAPHREAILKGIDDMALALESATMPPISLHVGVVRAGGCDTSTRGATCGVRSPEQFVRSEWCNALTNVSGAYPEVVTCLGDLGTENCGPAQPLSAALQAIEGAPRPGWEGFLRPDAYLAIVVIAAEDDASGTPGAPASIVDLAARVKSIKGDPSQVTVSIVGPEGCSGNEPTRSRLCQFAAEFGANGLYIRIGSGQLAVAVQRLTENLNTTLLHPCITQVRDVDAGAPGLQPTCTAVRTSVDANGVVLTSSLPSCDGNQSPCWQLDASVCGGQPGYAINIQSEPNWCYEAGTNFTIECLGCADANDPACAAGTR